jgi:hypothetical protein
VSASGDGVLAIDDAEEDLDGILSELNSLHCSWISGKIEKGDQLSYE